MATNKTCGALILAGGRGKRIGYDKKEITLGGEKLIDRLLSLLRGAFDEIIVSSNTPFERAGVLVVRDTLGAGPLAGLYSALSVCVSDYLYVTACDMPFISLTGIDTLKDALRREEFEAAVTRRADGFLEPFNALYTKRCAEKIRPLLESGQYKMGALLEKLTLRINDAYDEKTFFNINYPADLEKGKKEAGF
jgi:molybdopterin-guanine dinucleotide biosynthesis protein A